MSTLYGVSRFAVGRPSRATNVRLLVGVLLAGLVLVGGAGVAGAHNELIGSDPADGAQLPASPTRVVLMFDLPVQRGFSTVTVTGPDRQQWTAGPAVEEGAVVSAPLRPLGPAGQYTVGYRVLSADGHPVRGVVRFTLLRPGSAATPSGAGPAPPPNGSGSTASGSGSTGVPGWVWGVGAAALLGVGLGVALGRRQAP
jgi:methionine-rich copper-binding protein CopC